MCNSDGSNKCATSNNASFASVSVLVQIKFVGLEEKNLFNKSVSVLENCPTLTRHGACEKFNIFAWKKPFYDRPSIAAIKVFWNFLHKLAVKIEKKRLVQAIWKTFERLRAHFARWRGLKHYTQGNHITKVYLFVCIWSFHAKLSKCVPLFCCCVAKPRQNYMRVVCLSPDYLICLGIH